MALLNFGAGLSALGSSVANTAGTMQLEQQKADLENQKVTLASQLQEGVETRLAGVKAGYDVGAIQARGAADIATAKATSGLAVQAQSQEAQNAADLSVKLAADPNYIAAQKALNSTDPTKMAQAADMMQQAALAKVQTDSATKVMNARQDIIDAQKNGDQVALAAANQKFSTLMTDPSAAAAMRTAAVANARVNEDAAARAATDLNVATAKLQDPNMSGDDAARAALQANVAQLTGRVRALNKAADDARNQANALFGGAAPSTGTGAALPPLSTFDRTPTPVTPAAPAPTPGLINAPAK